LTNAAVELSVPHPSAAIAFSHASSEGLTEAAQNILQHIRRPSFHD